MRVTDGLWFHTSWTRDPRLCVGGHVRGTELSGGHGCARRLQKRSSQGRHPPPAIWL